MGELGRSDIWKCFQWLSRVQHNFSHIYVYGLLTLPYFLVLCSEGCHITFLIYMASFLLGLISSFLPVVKQGVT